jgi:1-aminocyclopropane-1-carboxylate deaminase
MIAGLAHSNRAQDIIGIDASATVEKTWDQIKRIATRTAKLIDLGRELRDEEIVLLDRWHDGIYGVAGQRTIEAIKMVGSLEGMITDPVYEGKSMAGMIDLIKEGYFKDGSKVLYVHLGGQPAINGYTTAF